MTKNGSDRRSEQRSPGGGVIKITSAAGSEFSFDARLLDVSASGFRVSHTHPVLERGSDVLFHHPRARGTARVIWNRIFDGQSETGFLILGTVIADATQERTKKNGSC